MNHDEQHPWAGPSALPKGFYPIYWGDVDLERAFARLEGCTHFYAETFRAQIRSNQDCREEASERFERAVALGLESPTDRLNLARRVMTASYQSLASLATDAPLPLPPLASIENTLPGPIARLGASPERALRELDPLYPELSRLLAFRRYVEALHDLRAGRSVEAEPKFRRLLALPKKAGDSRHAMYLLGLAASLHNQGQVESALSSLEGAGIAVHMIRDGMRINQLILSCCLAAVYRSLEMVEEARSWEALLDREDCPAATREAFHRRADRIHGRCVETQSLQIF